MRGKLGIPGRSGTGTLEILVILVMAHRQGIHERGILVSCTVMGLLLLALQMGPTAIASNRQQTRHPAAMRNHRALPVVEKDSHRRP
jgi:hypothetical protein